MLKKGDKVLLHGVIEEVTTGDMPYYVKVGPQTLWYYKNDCRPLNTKVSRKPASNNAKPKPRKRSKGA
jgi:hypothetical protein